MHCEEPGSTAYLPTGHSISFESPSTATNQPGFANVHFVALVASEKDPADAARRRAAPQACALLSELALAQCCGRAQAASARLKQIVLTLLVSLCIPRCTGQLKVQQARGLRRHRQRRDTGECF